MDSGSGVPVIPLPNPGEGGPVDSGGGVPVIPLPNPGEGGPVYPGGQGSGIPSIPVWPAAAQARFLNAAYGYPSYYNKFGQESRAASPAFSPSRA